MAGSRTTAPESVDEFLRVLEHPLKPEIRAVRKLILATDSKIGEGIKWKAPSFQRGEYFATFNLRATDSIQLILHLGAKVKELPAEGLQIADPQGLLKWLARDRAIATLKDRKDIEARGAALQKIVKQWIRHL
ncbi:MAG: DUF1801 domain-containing protein [Steroidobacteraceae bacterium]